MQYAHRYIQYAVLALEGYQGSLPLQHYLKQFFAADKKYGSKDRRHISHLCYCYFRTGNAFGSLAVAERIRLSLFLCSDTLEGWAALFAEEWVAGHSSAVRERVAFVQQQGIAFDMTAVFPLLSYCSESMDTQAFALSHLVQPDVFVRIRPKQEKRVLEVLNNNKIVYRRIGPYGVALAPGSKADQLLQLNREAVVQDLSSQRVAELLAPLDTTRTWQVWDCCAASGGKSILVTDVLPHIQLTVSDVRASIIHNLKQRFAEAGIRQYRSFVADLSNKAALKQSDIPAKGFDLVVCDAPCSGSGTWGRTPEQLAFFTAADIDRYAGLQKQIAATASAAVAEGGYFLYITCSVFAGENEQQVAAIQQRHGLQLVEQRLLTGYTEKADTMFAALFMKA